MGRHGDGETGGIAFFALSPCSALSPASPPKTPITNVTSGRCVPPAKGSLTATTSPGCYVYFIKRRGNGHRH